MLVGLFFGMFIGSATIIAIYYWRCNWKPNQFTENNIIEIVERSKDIIYYYQIKPIMKHRFISKSVEAHLGKGVQKILLEDSEYVFQITHPDDKDTMSKKLSDELDYTKPIRQRFRSTDGEYIWFEEYITPVYRNGQLVAIQGILRNINEKKLLEEELQYQIFHDSLTKIYNRSYFEKTQNQYNEQENTSVGLIICDLDHLKYVNDCFGHQSGDAYIMSAAKLLKETVGNSGIVARIGGDEFAILLENISEQTLAKKVEELTQAFELHGEVLTQDKSLNMSMGYAWTKNSKGDMDFLYAEADARMYENKRKRKQLN